MFLHDQAVLHHIAFAISIGVGGNPPCEVSAISTVGDESPRKSFACLSKRLTAEGAVAKVLCYLSARCTRPDLRSLSPSPDNIAGMAADRLRTFNATTIRRLKECAADFANLLRARLHGIIIAYCEIAAKRMAQAVLPLGVAPERDAVQPPLLEVTE